MANSMAFACKDARARENSDNLTIVSFEEAIETDYRDSLNDVLFDPEDDE